MWRDISKRATLVVALAGIAAFQPLAAQEPVDTTKQAVDTTKKQPVVLEPLEVTAAREHAAPPPVATIDLTGSVLEHTPSDSPYDMFRRAAAVEVHEQGQGPGFASDVVVRGFTSDHSGDVLLVVDGVPVNLPINGHGEGYSDWNSLQSEAVSSLRLIHGPASPLYGDFALAGVVEAFTSADAEGTSMAVTGSSYGDVGGWLRTGRREDNGGSMLAVSGERSEGWRDNSHYWLVNSLLRGWKRAGSAGRIEGGLGVYATGWNSPGFVSVADYNADNLKQATDPTDGGEALRIVAHGRYATPLGTRTAFETTAWAFSSRWDLYLNIPETGEALQQTGEKDRRLAAGAQSSIVWTPTAGEFTFGVAGRIDGAEYQRDQTTGRVPVAAEDNVEADYASGSSFARYRRTFGTKFGVDIGARLDVLHYGSRNWIDGGAFEEHTRAIVSPKAGVRYLVGENTSLLASLSHGFRGAPGVIEDVGRAPLQAWASEVGVDWHGDRADVQVSAFRTDVSNERIVDPVTLEITSAGTSVRQGFDGRARVRLFGVTSLTFAGTWTDSHLTGEFADAHLEGALAGVRAPIDTAIPVQCDRGPVCLSNHDEGGQGKEVPGVAKYTVQAGINTVLASKYLVALNARALGPYTPIGEPDIRTQPYIVFDLSGQVPLGAGLQLDLAIQNLFDTKYPEIRASGFINPGPPLTLRAAFNWSPSTN